MGHLLLKYVIVMPIAFVWDLTYMIISGIYDLTTKIDRWGEKFLDKYFS